MMDQEAVVADVIKLAAERFRRLWEFADQPLIINEGGANSISGLSYWALDSAYKNWAGGSLDDLDHGLAVRVVLGELERFVLLHIQKSYELKCIAAMDGVESTGSGDPYADGANYDPYKMMYSFTLETDNG